MRFSGRKGTSASDNCASMPGMFKKKGKQVEHTALFSDYPKHTVDRARRMGWKFRVEKINGPRPFQYLFYTFKE